MFHRRIRNARLRSSSSESRSRSTTPSGNRSAERQSHARRGLLMGLLSEAPRNIESSPPRKVRAMAVESTPGGSLTVSHELVLNQTPGGTIRRAAETASVNVAERVEAMDLSDSEIEDLLETNRDHLLRWIPELAAIPSTSGSSSNSLTAAMLPPPLPSQIPSASPSSSGATVIRIVDYDSDGSGLDSVYDDDFDRIGATTTTRDIPDDVTLDASDRVIINDVARSMDDEADRLLGTSPNFTWSEDFQSFRGVPEPFTGPTPGPVNDYSTIYDAFVDIWDKDIINHIVCETNRYAELTIERLRAKGTFRRSSRVYRWEPTNADEIMVFFAVMQYMAIDTRTSLSEYWSKGVLGMPLFRGLLSYNRYILLNKFLHFVDNSDTHRTMPLDGVMGSARELSPRLSKLAPIISHLGKKFDSLYRLKPHISIDESLTLFKGRLSWVQTIRSKSARFGIKSYELCESETGYMARFQIYTGKDDVLSDAQISADLGLKSARTVLELLRGLERRGHCVTMDNFYNCPSLARYLKSQGFDCLGTLRPNRRYVPNEIAKVPANVQKGTIVARHSGDVSIVAWKDSKVVNIISTFHNADTYVGSRAGKTVVKPVCIRDYNKYMGGIDLKDQKLSMYLLERKRGVKWYVKLFKRLLNVSILNSMIMNAACLVRRGQPSMTHREYRYSLAELIIEKHRSSRVIERPVSGLMRLRRDVLHEPAHHPGANNKRRCRVCYAKTKTKKSSNYRCVPCDVFLCFGDCWREWHSLEQLQPQEERSRRRQRE